MRVGLIIILCFPLLVLAQIKNPSFENWNTVNGMSEPDGWLSDNWANATDTNQWVKRVDTMARTGNSCVYISNEPRAGFEPAIGDLLTYFVPIKAIDTIFVFVNIPDSTYRTGKPAASMTAVGLPTFEYTFSIFDTNQTNGWILWRIPYSFSAVPDSIQFRLVVGNERRYQPGAFFDDIFIGKHPLHLLQSTKISPSVFPNPTQNYLNLQGDFSSQAKFTCYNLSGKRVNLNRLNASRFAVSHLPTGIYVLKISNGGIESTVKFVKE